MNIIIVRPNTSNFGKIGTYNVQEVGLAKALIHKGHNVTVIYTHRTVSTIETDSTYDYVKYIPHRTFGLHGIFKVNVFSQYSPDLVIMFSDNQLWAKNIITWCGKRGIKCIQYMGAVLSDNPKWLNQFYTKLILKRNIRSYKKSINIAKTNKVRIEMEKLGVRCSGVISVGLDDTILQNTTNLDMQIRASLGFDRDEMVLLFVGRLVNYKKPMMACDILNTLLKKGVKARLVIIGQGTQKEQLLEYIKQLDIEKQVTYVGRVSYDSMYRYYVACDCLINLSAQEIFGMTILEAMYYSIPVVAHTAPGPNDIIKNKKTGYLIDSDDLNVWCNAIKSAIDNRIELGTASRKCITDNYMWDKIAEQFCDLYSV